MNSYKVFRDVRNNSEINYKFYKCSRYSDIPGVVNAVLSVAMIGDAFAMAKKRNGWWDISGGKIESGESIEECLYRENLEELGVHISVKNLYLIGYIRAVNSTDKKFDKRFDSVNYMPVYIVFVKEINREWKGYKKEIIDRGIYTFDRLPSLLENRNDNGQLNDILTYANICIKSWNLRYEFTFLEKDRIPALDAVPVTQVMVFCKNRNKQYCIVKDYNETYYSLPGGGCELNESPLNAIKRELFEEAQIRGKNFKLLGTVKVDLFVEEEMIASIRHERYTCDIEKVKEFVPRENGFEVEERLFVKKEELYEKVMLLNNPTGLSILKKL